MVSKMAVKVSFQFNTEFSDVGQHIRVCLMSTVTVGNCFLSVRECKRNSGQV